MVKSSLLPVGKNLPAHEKEGQNIALYFKWSGGKAMKSVTILSKLLPEKLEKSY